MKNNGNVFLGNISEFSEFVVTFFIRWDEIEQIDFCSLSRVEEAQKIAEGSTNGSYKKTQKERK